MNQHKMSLNAHFDRKF